jgi:2-alkyl-3-oxoalkanoate reductase
LLLGPARTQLDNEATTLRVLLTGATGFVGRHVADAFARAGFRVRALARSAERARHLVDLGFHIVYGDLDDAALLADACSDTDVVVHMAALTHARTDAEYDSVNVAGTRRLLHAALQQQPTPSRFVYLSSLAAAGPCADVGGFRVADAPQPLTAYGRSKLAGEYVVLEAAQRMEIAILRAPAVYGPYDTDLYHFFRLAKYGVIPVPTGPARPLQMVHVADLAAALVRAVEAESARGVYHIAEARTYTWEEVGRLVSQAVGGRARIVRVPARLISGLAAASELLSGAVGRSSIFNRDKARELLAPGWLCETDAARADLGYEAGIPLDEGLRSTAQWYRQQGWL